MASDSTSPDTGLAELARRNSLQRVGGRPPLRDYLRETWERRYFAFAMARASVRASNSKDALGPAWQFLQPLLLAGIYLLIFGSVVGTGRGIANFPAYLTIGVFTFHHMSQSVRGAAVALTGNAPLVRSLQFPRMVLPVVQILEELILLVPTLGVLIVVVLVTGATPSVTWLLVPVIFAIQTCFNLGLGLVFARVASHSHDFIQVLPFIIRIWFYLSGVFWAVERVAAYPVLRFVFEVNPGYVYLHLVRQAFLEDVPATDYATWPLAIGWAVLALAVGVPFFWRGEDVYGRD